MDWCDVSIYRRGAYPFVKVDITKTREWVPLIIICDAHIGARNFRRKEFSRLIQLAKDADALVILLGDLTENANKRSVGAGAYEQTMTPDQQTDAVAEYLWPIQDNIIGALPGNHEWRTYKGDGHKATRAYLRQLRLTGPGADRDVYLGFEFWGAIGQHNGTNSRAYTVYGCHSLTSSKTSGLMLNTVGRDWSFIRSDLKLKAHDHNLGHQQITQYNPNAANAGVSELTEHHVLCGNWVGREDSYAAQKPFAPKQVGTVMTWLKMNGREKVIQPEFLYDGRRAERPAV